MYSLVIVDYHKTVVLVIYPYPVVVATRIGKATPCGAPVPGYRNAYTLQVYYVFIGGVGSYLSEYPSVGIAQSLKYLVIGGRDPSPCLPFVV